MFRKAMKNTINITTECLLYLLTNQYIIGEIIAPPNKANITYHPIISIPNYPPVITVKIDAHEIKKYINPEVAAATLVCTYIIVYKNIYIIVIYI